MARSRNLKPTFFHDAELLECDFWVRLLFQGLWCYADRRGILAENLKQIKLDVFPGDDVNIDAGLSELERRGFIERYTAAGRKCIHITSFSKHQNPHKDEKPSDLLAPDEQDDPAPGSRADTVSTPGQHATAPTLTPDSDVNRENPHGDEEIEEHRAGTVQTPDNPGVNPAITITVSNHGSREPITDTAPEAQDAPTALVRIRYSTVFEQFWSEWQQPPSKGHGSKKEAYDAWKALGLDRRGADAERQMVLDGLHRWQACGRWLDGYVRDCHRWLNKRMFGDDPPAGDPRNGARASPGPQNRSRGEDPHRFLAIRTPPASRSIDRDA